MYMRWHQEDECISEGSASDEQASSSFLGKEAGHTSLTSARPSTAGPLPATAAASDMGVSTGPTTAENRLQSHALVFSPEDLADFDVPMDTEGHHDDVQGRLTPPGSPPGPRRPLANEHHAAAPRPSKRPSAANLAGSASSTTGARQTHGLNSTLPDHAAPVGYIAAL